MIQEVKKVQLLKSTSRGRAFFPFVYAFHIVQSICRPQKLHLFNQKYSNIAKYYKKKNSLILEYMLIVFYSCDDKADFDQSLLQCHVILQKSFEYADLVLKKHFLSVSILKQLGCFIFLWNPF